MDDDEDSGVAVFDLLLLLPLYVIFGVVCVFGVFLLTLLVLLL